MEYKLINANENNRDDLYNFKYNIIINNEPNITKKDLEQINNYVKESLDKELFSYQMIMVDENVAGMLLVNKYNDGVLLSDIYLKEQYRGYHIASSILKNIINKEKIVYLWVYKTNINAINLYQKYNFKTIKETETRYFMKYINN